MYTPNLFTLFITIYYLPKDFCVTDKALGPQSLRHELFITKLFIWIVFCIMFTLCMDLCKDLCTYIGQENFNDQEFIEDSYVT